MLKQLSAAKCFGGWVKKFSHESSSTKTLMKVSVFLPPQAETGKVPALYYLAGLTCNEDNFMQKAGACKYAAEHGIALICPDTSPRGLQLADEHKDWDFGSGAGFYLKATNEPWAENYNMYDYVTKELPALVEKELPLSDKRSITGHSMGGHGALSLFLKNPGMYSSVSAFAPICNPCKCPWGQKAFAGYLGADTEAWKAYDATELIATFSGPKSEILVDQGLADGFLDKQQLLPENLVAAAKAANHPVQLRMHEDYDHSYNFIQSFVQDHIEHHAKALNA